MKMLRVALGTPKCVELGRQQLDPLSTAIFGMCNGMFKSPETKMAAKNRDSDVLR
jgi:hypothetical protein